MPLKTAAAMLVQCPRFLALLTGLVLLIGTTGAGWVSAQPDSVRTEILTERGFSPDHSPTGALWRSAAVPGWGQYYNRQSYKIPFVYAGFAALGYRIITSHQDYLLFKRAHLFQRGPELDDGPFPQYESQFNEVSAQLGTERASVIREQRDQFRRRRNLSIALTGLLYALNILDAYVSAHLLTFDVGETLDMQVRPVRQLGTEHWQQRRTRSGPTPQSASDPVASVLEEESGIQLQLRF